jgi:hypothetical protein
MGHDRQPEHPRYSQRISRAGAARADPAAEPGPGVGCDGAGFRRAGPGGLVQRARPVWNLYYAQIPDKINVIAYISSVAGNSGANDTCQPADTTLPLTDPAPPPA